jgi:C1A family cysteine protease
LPIEIAELVSTLNKAKARWRAKETPQSRMSEEDVRRMLGAEPHDNVMASLSALAAAPPASPTFAPEVDWRNRGGNHITPVKDQGGCGSCVSFASTALVESRAHIEKGLWLALSEADSHFCSSHGANCSGWWPDQCLDQIIARGECDEVCFSYASAFPGNDIWSGPPQCKPCANRNQRAVKITSRGAYADAVAIKNYLSSTGPMAGCFTVFDDFRHYSGGVYHHVSGAELGGHCVLIIGYSEAEQCWICKNSWGIGWGVGGFCKIAYDDFKFNGQLFPFYGANGVIVPNTGFQSLGGVLTTKPVVAKNKDGRLEVFTRGTDGALWHIWQTAPNSGWSGWSSLGGALTSDPCVISNADGRLEVFIKGTDNALWHIWQTAPSNGWSGWASLGGVITSNPAAGINKDGRLEVFARSTTGVLYHIWQTAPNNGWSGWASLGPQFSGNPAVGSNADGRLEVLFLGPGSDLRHIWQTAPNNGWSGWASLGGLITTSPILGRNADGRLEVFAKGTDGALWHVWQTAPNNGWSGWSSLGGLITSAPAIGGNADGRLEAIARGTDAALWHIWQTAPNSGWSGWSSLGGAMVGDPGIGSNADGRLEALVRGTDLALWHRWQTAPNNGWN